MKIAAALFLCVMVPVNTHYYGAIKFLWFSQVGLFGTVLALWLESRLLASMMLLAIFLADGVAWTADFLMGGLTGWYPIGMTDYMFDPQWPLFVRGLSFFHVVVPVVLVWMVYKRGYDSRALLAQSLFGCVLLGVTYAMTDPKDNINRVYGPFNARQTLLPARLYLVTLMACSPILLYLPVHLVILLIRRLGWTTRKTVSPPVGFGLVDDEQSDKVASGDCS
jgi:hypothetical protein